MWSKEKMRLFCLILSQFASHVKVNAKKTQTQRLGWVDFHPDHQPLLTWHLKTCFFKAGCFHGAALKMSFQPHISNVNLQLSFRSVWEDIFMSFIIDLETHPCRWTDLSLITLNASDLSLWGRRNQLLLRWHHHLKSRETDGETTERAALVRVQGHASRRRSWSSWMSHFLFNN